MYNVHVDIVPQLIQSHSRLVNLNLLVNGHVKRGVSRVFGGGGGGGCKQLRDKLQLGVRYLVYMYV